MFQNLILNWGKKKWLNNKRDFKVHFFNEIQIDGLQSRLAIGIPKLENATIITGAWT
jgi:hypothetical protein